MIMSGPIDRIALCGQTMTPYGSISCFMFHISVLEADVYCLLDIANL